MLAINRPRDIALSLFAPLISGWLRKQAYFRSWVGGNARRKCLQKKWINYQLVIFEK